MAKHSRVVIVGRVNVGKSSLFNRLSTSVRSMTFDYEGVTRDFIKDVVSWKDSTFELMDTGGISLKKTTDPISERIRNQALELVESSDIVIFVVDASVGLLPEDKEIAKLLHRLGKKVLVVVNKIDVAGARENIYSMDRLGFADIVPISCQHGTGIGDILEFITNNLPPEDRAQEEDPACRVVLLGKPNVGKSSLLNALLQQERSFVANEPGTTREPISERIAFHQEDLLITDTPGIRRQRSVQEKLEGLMVKGSLQELKRADIVLLLVDASEKRLSDQELKLAFYAFNELNKSLIIIFNKSDLFDEYAQEELKENMKEHAYFFKKVEQLFISCKTGKNVGKVLTLINEVWQRSNQKFSSNELTLFCQDALLAKPLYHKTELLKLFRVRQVAKAPITLLFIVNQPKWFGPSQLGYFDNLLRRKYNLKGVSLRILLRTN